MLEIAESPYKPVDHAARVVGGRSLDGLVAETIQGAIRAGLLEEGAEIVSLYHRHIEHGYPTPSVKERFLSSYLLFFRSSHN